MESLQTPFHKSDKIQAICKSHSFEKKLTFGYKKNMQVD